MLQQLLLLLVFQYFLRSQMAADAHMSFLPSMNFTHILRSDEDIYKVFCTLLLKDSGQHLEHNCGYAFFMALCQGNTRRGQVWSVI